MEITPIFINNRINKLWYIHTMRYYTVTKMNEQTTATWDNMDKSHSVEQKKPNKK